MAARIHSQPRHALSKKFSAYATYSIEDLKGQLRQIPYSDCIERNPTIKPYGRMRRGIWCILQEYYSTKKGIRRRREVRVVEILFLAQLARPFTEHERIHQTCKTKGCLNLKHYQLLGDKAMIDYDQVLIIYEQAILQGKLTVPVGDAGQARALRLACYPHKKAMEVKNPQVFKQIHGIYELVIRKGDLICQKKGLSDSLLSVWAAAGLPSKSNSKQQEEMLARSMDQLREMESTPQFIADQMDATLKNMGYTAGTKQKSTEANNNRPLVQEHDGNEEADEEIAGYIAKMERGEMLTPQENSRFNALGKAKRDSGEDNA